MARKGGYKPGRKVEWRVRDYLEKYGYEVMRSTRSRKKWDLVAVKENIVRLIQVKKGKVTKSRYKKYLPLCAIPGLIIRECWFWQPRKGFQVVHSDSFILDKIEIKKAEEVLEIGSRKDNR